MTDSKVCSINALTALYGLVGQPVSHSLSPTFWNAAFGTLNINAAYVALSVLPENIKTAFLGLQATGFVGINITRPYKYDAYGFCSILHDAARETGVVNTIKFHAEGAEGWNTDATGLLCILKKFDLPHGNVLILGDGASSRSAIWALREYGVETITQIARKFKEDYQEKSEKKENFEKNFTKLCWNSKNFTNSVHISDIIINTTPIGWQEKDDIPELRNGFDKGKSYIDFNYSKVSRLLHWASQKGSLVIDGRELLYHQGLEAFKLLTNLEPPAEVIRSSIFC